jgi:hypothetical protein
MESGGKIAKKGCKAVKPGFYDIRNWDVIRSWAKGLVA